ncbi:DUF1292 domain-containing protein [Petralouisia muris]|jgi:uncharacterized protein YrzB (UPF0473 family)|uniref:DUF1292 domain-containing protein n=1 Tax=Petralouisia muris TaxID=3032872 RepID=A0AC61RY32_9FIRM|nr:DUF1292 domain-containing protein [Petralouisia muris]TGY96870.1 DUF1292 domain-containing protein [Petralouisia muris]
MSNKPNTHSEHDVLEEDDSDIRVTLSMDDNSEVECRILTIFEMEDQDYIALLPLDEEGDDNEEGEVFIYRYFEDDDGNPSLENIEEEKEFQAVSACFDDLLEEAEWDALLEDD